MLLYLADLYFYSLSIRLCCYNHSFEFIYENIITVFFQMPIFGVVEILTAISPKPTQIFYSYFQSFLFLSNTLTDKRLKTKPIKLSKFAFSAVGPLVTR